MSDYFTLKIQQVTRETPDTVTLHFKQPLFRKVKYKAGQFLTLLFTLNGQKVRRSYSMSSVPNLDSYVSVTVKRVEGGLVSNHINDHLKAGDSVEVMEPMGRFVLEPDRSQKRHVVLFGAGSGITPLMSILRSVLYFEKDSIVSLVYGNRNREQTIFFDKLESLRQEFGGRLQVVHTFTQPEASWGGYRGRIDEALTANVLNLLPKWDKTEYFLCGPEGMMAEVRKGLNRLKVRESQIHSESFSSAAEAKSEDTSDLSTRQVRVILHGQEHAITVQPNQTILDAALDFGLDVPFSCQSGMCTACMGTCRSGQVRMRDTDALTPDELAKGYVLTCVGHPLTDDVCVEIA